MRAAEIKSAALILLFIICCSVLFTTRADSVTTASHPGLRQTTPYRRHSA